MRRLANLMTPQKTFMRLGILLIVCAVLAGADTSRAADDLFDDFSDVGGGSLLHVNTNGSKTNVIHGTLVNGFEIYSPGNTVGILELVARDDEVSLGADGMPGVWTLEVQRVPQSGWWAASYFGDDVSEGFVLPAWPDPVTWQDLANTTVEFKYRAVNDLNPQSSGLDFFCRLEPLNDSYNNRAGFGRIAATEGWQTFRRSLADTDNVYNFLYAVNAGEHLKLTVANAGGYQVGDALQIDDLRIDVVPEPNSMILVAIGVICIALMRWLRR